jgi:hypothetical protein
MRGLKTLASAHTVAAGHAFVQNLRRGQYKLTADYPIHDRSALRSRGLPTASEHRRRAAFAPSLRQVSANATDAPHCGAASRRRLRPLHGAIPHQRTTATGHFA